MTPHLLLALFLAVSAGVVYRRPHGLSHEDAFTQFNAFWNKSHASSEEKLSRFENFKLNAQRIDQLNAARKFNHSASFGFTQFSDMTAGEFKALLGFKSSRSKVPSKRSVEQAGAAVLQGRHGWPTAPSSPSVPVPFGFPFVIPTSAPTQPPVPTFVPTGAPTSPPTNSPTNSPTNPPTGAPAGRSHPQIQPITPPATPLPPSSLSAKDWVAQGMVTPVKDQGQCGSCWAHSAAETIESANLIAGKTVTPLSPQQLVNCDTNDEGCNGGDPREAMRWVSTQGGLATAACFPYTGQDGSCTTTCPPSLTVKSVVAVSSDESAMYNALQISPLSIACYADDWMNYESGVFMADQCSSTSPDHAIQLTGFSPNNGGYWIVRNSWGTSWGQQGYIWLQYGQNTCGITTQVTYATA